MTRQPPKPTLFPYPPLSRSLLNLGMALSMAGRPREAIPRLEAALRLRPDLLPASLFLGAARLELGQPARAVAPLQRVVARSEEHTSELQSPCNLVCRLLLEN